MLCWRCWHQAVKPVFDEWMAQHSPICIINIQTTINRLQVKKTYKDQKTEPHNNYLHYQLNKHYGLSPPLSPLKKRFLVIFCKNGCCWWWHFDWTFACLIAPVVTTTSIIPSSNKIQNRDILVPAKPGPPAKWLLKQRWRVIYNLQKLEPMLIISYTLRKTTLWMLERLNGLTFHVAKASRIKIIPAHNGCCVTFCVG